MLVQLTRLPWWLSVVLAVLVFAALRWGASAVAGSRPTLMAMAQVAAASAPWLAAVFLLPVPFALVSAARRRRLVDAQPNLDRLRTLPWLDFEQLIGEFYRRKGYRVVERGGNNADGGIDLELRTKDKKIVVQCKRWQARSIGVALVRELYGAMTGAQAHGAVFVTSGRYTPDAIDFARDKPIQLIDGAELVAMLRDLTPRTAAGGGCIAAAETPVITTAQGPVTCPQCGRAMVRRVAKQGAHAGDSFWGCSRFPSCRGTRPL